MAEQEPKPKRATKRQGQRGNYWIVNPRGAIHGVTREHAAERLRQPGWRMATEEEIEQATGQRTQRWDAPIAAPWAPEADLAPELPE